MNNKASKLRLIYALIFLLLVAVEVFIALFVNDKFIRPYGGDIIVIGVLYCFARIFFPQKIKLLPLYLFAIGVIAEIGQLIDYVSLLGLQDSRFFKILLGSSFSWLDIICYAVGSAICLGVQLLTFEKLKNK